MNSPFIVTISSSCLIQISSSMMINCDWIEGAGIEFRNLAYGLLRPIEYVSKLKGNVVRSVRMIPICSLPFTLNQRQNTEHFGTIEVSKTMPTHYNKNYFRLWSITLRSCTQTYLTQSLVSKPFLKRTAVRSSTGAHWLSVWFVGFFGENYSKFINWLFSRKSGSVFNLWIG